MTTKLPFSARARLDVGALATLSIAFTLGACGSAVDSEDDADFRGKAQPGVICHIPSDNPGAAKTIWVDPNAVADHLAHGDTVGPCPSSCNLACDELGAAIADQCHAAPLGVFPDGFCDGVAETIAADCDAACPEPAPETCNDFCHGIRDEVRESCWAQLADAMLCDIGANATYQACAQIFECPPPPPTCHEACEQTRQDAYAQCFAGGDPTCFHDADEEAFSCHDACCIDDCNAGCTTACQGDPQCANDCAASCELACQPPPGPQCFGDCWQQLDAATIACDAAGRDPACYEQAHDAMNLCQADCCVQDCGFMCAQGCGGDSACSDDCQMQCTQWCLPPAPCPEQTCWDGSCASFGELCPPPPVPGCWEQCFMSFDAAMLACSEAGGDMACFDAAHADLSACHGGCCVEDCSLSCEVMCMGAPACVHTCQMQQCVPACFPTEPCAEQTCWDGSCAPFIEACPPPPQGPCDPLVETPCADGTCVPLGEACSLPPLWPPCDPLVETPCADGTCVPLGMPCG